MSDHIFTNGLEYIRIARIPDADKFSKLCWHMNASGAVWKPISGTAPVVATIHWNRIATVITGFIRPSFSDYMDEHEGGTTQNKTTPPKVFLQFLEEAIEERRTESE